MYRNLFSAVGIFFLTIGCVGQVEQQALRSEKRQSFSVEAVQIESDGWRLVADWRAPLMSCNAPAVLLLHNAIGDRKQAASLAKALQNRGIASLSLVLRGHGESTNLGKFQEPYSEYRHLNAKAYRDIVAGLNWIATQRSRGIGKVGVVGASYSGEQTALAVREGAKADAYVMLSPGNFSERSVTMVSKAAAPWLFVRTEEEVQGAKPFVDRVFAALQENAPDIEVLIYPGEGHAMTLLESRPEAISAIADWLSAKLEADGAC